MRLRKATIEDARRLFEWRNDPVTRAVSVNQTPVDWHDHLAWLMQSLDSPLREILIAEDGVPLGTVRLDKDIRTEVSITLAPAARGHGQGAVILQLATAGTGPFVARIRPDNKASQKVFEKAGFSFTHHADGMNWYLKH